MNWNEQIVFAFSLFLCLINADVCFIALLVFREMGSALLLFTF